MIFYRSVPRLWCRSLVRPCLYSTLTHRHSLFTPFILPSITSYSTMLDGGVSVQTAQGLESYDAEQVLYSRQLIS